MREFLPPQTTRPPGDLRGRVLVKFRGACPHRVRRPTKAKGSRKLQELDGEIGSRILPFFVFLVSAPREYHYIDGVIFVSFFRILLFIIANHETVGVLFCFFYFWGPGPKNPISAPDPDFSYPS